MAQQRHQGYETQDTVHKGPCDQTRQVKLTRGASHSLTSIMAPTSDSISKADKVAFDHPLSPGVQFDL